jgi:hypothetical protein
MQKRVITKTQIILCNKISFIYKYNVELKKKYLLF